MGLALSRPLLLRSTGSRRAGSAVVAHGPSCSPACGIFPDQGSNPCPLHWQADSQPLHHQGSPPLTFHYAIWLGFITTYDKENSFCFTTDFSAHKTSYLFICKYLDQQLVTNLMLHVYQYAASKLSISLPSLKELE